MRYADWPLSAPVNITWEITHHCNLRCIHCLSASSDESPDELSFDECRAIVDQLAALQVFEINFGGGEPLLKDYFLPLLRYIHEKGIVTCVSTNGTVLTLEAVACFAGSPLVNVQVSLDGATPDVNDRIRGAGTFHRIVNGIERLAGKNIPLSINTVVTSLNFDQLDRIKELAAFYGPGCGSRGSARPGGRGKAGRCSGCPGRSSGSFPPGSTPTRISSPGTPFSLSPPAAAGGWAWTCAAPAR